MIKAVNRMRLMEKTIHAIKANLIKELWRPETLTGIIHSRFRSVINIRLDKKDGAKRLVTLMACSRYMVPDSIVIDEKDFNELSVPDTGSRVIMRDGRLIFSNGMVCIVEGCNPHEGKLKLADSEGNQGNTPGILYAPGRLPLLDTKLSDFLTFRCGLQASQTSIGNRKKQLEAFAGALASINITQAVHSMNECIGYGMGLTPSADDAMVGIMALFEGAWQAGYLTAEYEAYKEMMNKLSRTIKLEGRTTDVSMKYLYCAMEGRFSDYLTELIRWTFTDCDKELWSLLLDISGVGASSGTDMLAGMGIACKRLLKALAITVPYDREEDYS